MQWLELRDPLVTAFFLIPDKDTKTQSYTALDGPFSELQDMVLELISVLLSFL